MKTLKERLRDHPRANYLSASPASIALCNEAATALDTLEAEVARLIGVQNLLADVFAALPPSPMRGPDGKTYEYHDPRASETLLVLRKRLDEGLAKLRATPLSAPKEDVTTVPGGSSLLSDRERGLEEAAKKYKDALEDMVDQFAYRSNDAKQKWFTAGGTSALEHAFVVLGYNDPHYIKGGGCEHPGCAEWDTCGTPTPDGYRRFCGEHYRSFQRTKDAAP